MAEEVSAVLLQQVSLSSEMKLVMKEGEVTHLLVNGSFSTSTKGRMKAKGEKVRSSCSLCISEGKFCILAQYATFSQLVNNNNAPGQRTYLIFPEFWSQSVCFVQLAPILKP